MCDTKWVIWPHLHTSYAMMSGDDSRLKDVQVSGPACNVLNWFPVLLTPRNIFSIG